MRLRSTSLSRHKISNIAVRLTTYSVLLFGTFLLLFPIAWILVSSLKHPQELFSTPVHWIPYDPTLDNYVRLINDLAFLTYLKNSFIVALSTTIVVLPAATLAAYSFSRLPIMGRNSFVYLFTMTQMFPSVLLMISMYSLMTTLGLVNTYPCLIILYTTFALPLSTLMVKSYLDSIPVDLEEAAMVDGCGRLGALFKVTLPTIAPGLLAAGIFAFILSWDEFLYALTFTSSDAMRTIPIGIMYFRERWLMRWELIMAGSMLCLIPVLIAFVFVRKFLLAGLTAGAVKG